MMSVLLRCSCSVGFMILFCLGTVGQSFAKVQKNIKPPDFTVVLPDSFLKQADTPSLPVTGLLHDIEQIQSNYLATLADEDPFYGLYVSGAYDQGLKSSDGSHRIGVEWELFDEGWNESLRRVDKKKVETKLQFLQMLANMQQKKFMENLYLTSMVNNQIQGLISQKKTATLQTLQENRKKQFQNGYVTKDDYLTIYYKYKNSELLASHYNNQDTALLSKPIFDIINRCEHIQLLPVESLLKRAIDKSVQIQIQDEFIQRTDFYPTWSDDLRLRVYAENVQYRGDNEQEQIVGVSFRLPIQTNGSREVLVSTEQDVYLKQKEAIRKRLGQRIPLLVERFQFHQQRIIIAGKEYDLMQQRLTDFTAEEKLSIPILDRTPQRSMDLLETELLDKELEILLARMKVYEMLLNLENLVQPDSIADLLETAVTLSLHSLETRDTLQ